MDEGTQRMAGASSVCPVVSVIVPAFNAERYIRSCLMSILSQKTYGIEVIVVDDGSTDGTRDVVREIASSFDVVQLHVCAMNMGALHARSIGVCQARGEYLAFVDADDELFPGALVALVEGIVSSQADVAVFGVKKGEGDLQSGEIIFKPKKERIDRKEIFSKFCTKEYGSGWLCNKLYRSSLIAPVFERVAASGLRSNEDYLVNIGVFLSAETVFSSPSVGYFYRRTGGVSSRLNSEPARNFFELLLSYSWALRFYGDCGEKNMECMDMLYQRQLRMSGRFVSALTELDDYRSGLTSVMKDIAEIRPQSIYPLVHTFEVKTKRRFEKGLIDALMRFLRGRQ